MENKLLLFDGNNHIIRSHFGIRSKNEFGVTEVLTTSDGRESGTLYSAITAFASLVREQTPTHCLWTFDSGRSKLRTALRPEYKANRDTGFKTDFRPTFDAFEEFLSIVGVRFVREGGVEADDIIASACKKFSPYAGIYIVSQDHDLLQLIDDNISVIHAGKPKPTTFQDIVDKYKLKPKQLPMLWALTGDPGDNIIGIKGVGEKTAYKMLEFGNFNLYDTCKYHPKAKDMAVWVMQNYEMIKLDSDISQLDVTLDECKFVPEMNSDLLVEWLASWEMNSLVSRVNRGTFWS
jgi:5'-3' exonuclease